LKDGSGWRRTTATITGSPRHIAWGAGVGARWPSTLRAIFGARESARAVAVVTNATRATTAAVVSPAELNKTTNWKGAPWKWLFANPKKNGYCDRWYYSFKVAQIDGETRYCATVK
jgi:hypothetical protein